MELLIIDEATSRELLEMPEAIDAVAESYAAISTGPVVATRGNVEFASGSDRGLLLGTYIQELHGVCFKAVGKWHGNSTAFVIASDTVHGWPEALILGSYATDFRTGAGSGAATRLLANPQAKRLAVLGTGRQAATQLRAMLTVRSIEQVSVWNRTAETARQWIDETQHTLGGPTPHFELAPDPESAVADADIVVTASRSDEPILMGQWLKPGCHINAVGSGSPTQHELDISVFDRADKIVVDARDLAIQSGDLIAALSGGIIDQDALVEIGDLLAAQTSVQADDRQITLFKSVGHAGNDLAIARLLAKNARERGLGSRVSIAA